MEMLFHHFALENGYVIPTRHAPEVALESFLIAGRRMIRQHVAAIPANSCGHFILSRARDLPDVARVSKHLRPER